MHQALVRYSKFKLRTFNEEIKEIDSLNDNEPSNKMKLFLSTPKFKVIIVIQKKENNNRLIFIYKYDLSHTHQISNEFVIRYFKSRTRF